MQRDNRLEYLPPVPSGAAEDEATKDDATTKAPPASRAKKTGAAKTKSASTKTSTTKAKRPKASASTSKPKPVQKKQVQNERPRLFLQYRNETLAALVTEFGYKNIMEAPEVKKIVINIGAGEAREEARALEGIQRDLANIAGQKPVVTRAKKAIAGFKIREGQPIGAAVTLRGTRMWFFLDRLISIALPRTRDFRGLSRKGFDGRGDYSMGLTEQIIFPEIDFNTVDKIRGLQVSIVTSAKSDQEGMRLLEMLGMPFVRQEAS
jgi:large subunit ribosomal protein L5